MKSKIVIADLKTDGVIPVDSEIYVDVEQEVLKMRCNALGMEIWLRLCDISMALGDELHG